MNTTQLERVLNQITASWPTWSPVPRQTLLAEKLKDFDFMKASRGIDWLIENWVQRKEPGISDILSAVRSAKSNIEPADCLRCENTGWLYTDVQKNTVEACGCNSAGVEPCRLKDRTSDGSLIATPAEKRKAIIKGYLSYDPGASLEALNRHMSKFGLPSDVSATELASVASGANREPF